MSTECIMCGNMNNLIIYDKMTFCKVCFDSNNEMSNNYEKAIVRPYEAPTKILDNLYIGNINSINNDNLTNLNISKIIIAGNNLKTDVHNNFECLYLKIDDSLEQDISESIKLSNEFIDDNITLVHCYSGISRSSSIVIGYLMKKFNWDYEKAYAFLKSKHSKAHPNSNFVNQLNSMVF